MKVCLDSRIGRAGVCPVWWATRAMGQSRVATRYAPGDRRSAVRRKKLALSLVLDLTVLGSVSARSPSCDGRNESA